MKRRIASLLVGGTLLLGAAYVGLPPLLERVYRVEEWRPDEGAWWPFADAGEGPRRPQVQIVTSPRRAPDDSFVELWGWHAGMMRIVVLRWVGGTFLSGSQRVSPDEIVPYVEGLLKANRADRVWVFFRHDANWGEVVSVADRLRGTTARTVYVSIEREGK